MVPEKYVLSTLNKWAKSAQGKKMLKEHGVHGDVEFAEGGGGAHVMSQAEMAEAGLIMANILYSHIVLDTPNEFGDGLWGSVPKSAILTGEPHYSEGDKSYVLDIAFDDDMLRRDSLYPEKYDGVDNIVRLFQRGYGARDCVYGQWKGKHTVSLTHRDPNDFMQRAVDEFNARYHGKVKAALWPKYNPDEF